MGFVGVSAACHPSRSTNVPLVSTGCTEPQYFLQPKDTRSYVRNLAVAKVIKPEKNSGLYRIRTHDLCDTSVALLPLELTSQLEDGYLGIHFIPVDSEYFHVYVPFSLPAILYKTKDLPR